MERKKERKKRKEKTSNSFLLCVPPLLLLSLAQREGESNIIPCTIFYIFPSTLLICLLCFYLLQLFESFSLNDLY